MKIPGITTERLNFIFGHKTSLIASSPSFTLKAIKNKENVNRVGIISGKKAISKLAVYRNRADRRIKSALQTCYPELKMKGYDFLFFSQPPVITAPWSKLLSDVQSALKTLEHKASKKK